MKIEQIYTDCLSQGAYYIESDGEAVIIDPLREVSPYLERAAENNTKIKYILETHFHADFVSGHVTLAEKTGAEIVFGPTANTSFESHIAEDGEILEVGKIKIKVLHTPGHTMESASYLLIDEEGNDYALFSGDTLFLGDVGRPDLAQKAADMTQEELAGLLFDSLRNKIMPLDDALIVYPAHGAGSACGKNMMDVKVDTLGNQKEVNYALRADMTREEFIEEVTDGLLPPPGYFPANVRLNKEGYESIDEVLGHGLIPLSPRAFDAIAKEEKALVLDVRTQKEFAESHVPNSIFIGLNGSFAPWVGELIMDVNQSIILVVNKGQEEEAVTRLARVGFDNTIGYLDGGIAAWKNAGKELESTATISADGLEQKIKEGKIKVFDVRRDGEYLSEHIVGAVNTPLSTLTDHIAEFPKDEEFFIHCAGGYRSEIAASILKSKGIHNFIDVVGGFKSIKETGIPRTDYVCPTTL